MPRPPLSLLPPDVVVVASVAGPNDMPSFVAPHPADREPPVIKWLLIAALSAPSPTAANVNSIVPVSFRVPAAFSTPADTPGPKPAAAVAPVAVVVPRMRISVTALLAESSWRPTIFPPAYTAPPADNPPVESRAPTEGELDCVSMSTLTCPAMSMSMRSVTVFPADAVVASVSLPPMLLLATGAPLLSTIVRI